MVSKRPSLWTVDSVWCDTASGASISCIHAVLSPPKVDEGGEATKACQDPRHLPLTSIVQSQVWIFSRLLITCIYLYAMPWKDWLDARSLGIADHNCCNQAVSARVRFTP